MKLGPRYSPEHYQRYRDLVGASQRALTALVVALGFAVVGISYRVWAFIPAMIAAVFGLVDVALAWRAYRASESRDISVLLAGGACRATDAHPSEYGVDTEALPAGVTWHYVERDFERELRAAVEDALTGRGPRLVILAGDSKAGKTRAAFQALQWQELGNPYVVVPRNGASIETLLQPGSLPEIWTPLVIWLDDFERYVSLDASGLYDGMLRNLECDRPVVLLATMGGRGARAAGDLADPIIQLEELATCVEVPVKLGGGEIERAACFYSRALIDEIELVGLGRRMVAMRELRGRMRRDAGSSGAGLAVIGAAIDWRRAGAQRPLSAHELSILYQERLPEHLDPGAEVFSVGLRWAREPLPNTQIPLLRKATDESDRYEPYDLAVVVANGEWPAVGRGALALMATVALPQDSFQMALAAFDASEHSRAIELLARAECSGDIRLAATSAFNMGILLAHKGDVQAAEAAYRRADERGSLRGAFNLGQLLWQRADLSGAQRAFRRAKERGSSGAAVNLGVLLEQAGELDDAELAYGVAAARGSLKGANNLRRLRGAGDNEGQW